MLAGKHEDLLIRIKKAEKERILSKDISEMDEPELRADLDFLISLDLVEYDKKDEAYYLTYEGYEEVEELEEMVTVGEAMTHIEYRHVLRHHRRKNLLWGGVIFLFVVLFTCAWYHSLKEKTKRNKQLEKQLRHHIQTDLPGILDSVDSVLKKKQKTQNAEEETDDK